MKESLLNKTVTVYRKTLVEGTGISSSGDIKKSDPNEKIETGVKIRITTNLPTDKDRMGEASGWQTAMWLGFTLTSVNIQINDTLEDEATEDRYLVMWIDKAPGGDTDDHYEIYMNDSRNK